MKNKDLIKTVTKIYWFLHTSPTYAYISFNLLCPTEVHLHASLCKLQFLLITQRLIAGTCLSGHGAHQRHKKEKRVTTAQRRLFYNQQPWCQAHTLSPLVAKPEPGPSLGHRHQMAEPRKRAGEISGEEEWGIERGNERKVRDWKKKKKRGWKAPGFGLIIRFLNSDGCEWICIA